MSDHPITEAFCPTHVFTEMCNTFQVDVDASLETEGLYLDRDHDEIMDFFDKQFETWTDFHGLAGHRSYRLYYAYLADVARDLAAQDGIGTFEKEDDLFHWDPFCAAHVFQIMCDDGGVEYSRDHEELNDILGKRYGAWLEELGFDGTCGDDHITPCLEMLFLGDLVFDLALQGDNPEITV